MSDLEAVVVDYIKEKHCSDLKAKKTVDKLELWGNGDDFEDEEINCSIDGLNLTAQRYQAGVIKGRLEDSLDSYKKGIKNDHNFRVLESSDGSENCIKLNLQDFQMTGTKEFFEKLLKEFSELLASVK